MKIQYLGTGGGGGIPEMFCNCRICQNARIRQGNELRNRSLAIIDDTLCMDLPCDARSNFLAWDIDTQNLRYLLVTHDHYDHFLADNLISRSEGAQPMQVFVSSASGQKIAQKAEKFHKQAVQQGLRPVCVPDIHFVKPFVPFTCGTYQVTPIPARHDPSVETLNFLIKGEKTVLWLHDTGLMLPETEQYLQEIQPHIDFISIDCALPCGRYFSEEHMDILRCNLTVELLRKFGCVDDKTMVYLSHISHLVERTHEELTEQAKQYNFHVACDGAVINMI